MTYEAAVITCSDRAAADIYEDRSGPILRQALAELGFIVSEPVIVPDDPDRISSAITGALAKGVRVVITTGGTGVGPRDVTVEATRPLLEYEIPGLMEETRRKGAEHTSLALLSRGVAGITHHGPKPALIVNAPGSRGGARDVIAILGPLLTHIIEQLDGADHV